MIPAELTASEAADLHGGLALALRTATADEFLHRYNELFGPATGFRSMGYAEGPDGRHDRIRAADIAHIVDEADTFLVDGHMVQVAAQAAIDLEGMPLFPADLPSRQMFVLLDDVGLEHWDPGFADINSEQVSVRAMLITEGPIVYGGDVVEGVTVILWCSRDQMIEAMDDGGEDHGRDRLWRPCGEFLPLDVTGWAYAVPWRSLSIDETIELGDEIRGRSHDGEVASHIGKLRRLILSLVLLMGQEVHSSRERVDRPTARRWERGPVKVPDDYSVAVTRLRRISAPEGEEPGEGGWLTHRFFVRGHWRRIHRGTPEERAVWVRPYIKGPDDGPFVQKHRVTVLDR